MIFDEEEEGQNRIMQILRVSYNHLSPPLKRCFSYCALFPKDYEIEIERLNRIWIANDCVARSSSVNTHIEDICEEYFSILVQRCFFQSLKYTHIFKVHDLMHDLAKEVSQEEIVLVEPWNSWHRQFKSKIRHLGIYDGRNMMDVETLFSNNRTFEAKKLHTFTVIGHVFWHDITGRWVSSLSSCKFLHVLDLKEVSMKFLPESIGSLIYLRYLNLSGNDIIEKLPESITKLWCLEYLLVRDCRKLKELPKDLKRLVNLKQLSMSGCHELRCIPHGMGSLTSLYMLDHFFVCQHKNHGQLKDLGQLRNLRGGLTIKIRNEAIINVASQGHDGELVTCLSRMENLSRLWVEFSRKYDAYEETFVADDNYMAVLEKLQPPTNIEELALIGYEGESVPRWLTNLMDYFPNLVALYIKSFLRFRCLPQIRPLHLLKSLSLDSLHNIEYMEEENISQDESSQSVVLFPCLEHMALKDMPRLKGWWKKECNIVGTGEEVENNQSYFPRLSYLHIEGCLELALFPSILSSNVEFTTDNLNFLVTMPWKLFPAGLKSLRVLNDKMSNYLTVEVEDAIRSIPDSLKYLDFYECDGLRALPRCLKHLKSLREMKIIQCNNFTCIEEEVEGLTDEERMMPWEGFKSLERLEFTLLPQLVTLPMEIQSVTSLQSIEITCFPSFGRTCFSTLKEIPEWMRKLSNLKSLVIHTADEILIERCKEVTGEDWPKIQDIPHVHITSSPFN